MSGSVLDSIFIERRGKPAAAVGVTKLAMTTGKGMARSQGFPDFPIAMIDHPKGALEGLHEAKEVDKLAKQAVIQVENILLGKS